MLISTRSFARFSLMLSCFIVNLARWQVVYSEEATSNQPAAGNGAASHLEQAATSIIAAAKEKIALESTSDEDAVQHARLSLEAIRILGTLGDIDANAQSEQLMEAIASAGRPAVVDALFQVRFANWPKLAPQILEFLNR